MVRKGFLTDQQYASCRATRRAAQRAEALIRHPPPRLDSEGELTAITWDQVDFEDRSITLEKGETKNDDPRSVPIINGDIYELLLQAKRERESEVGKFPVSVQSPRRAHRGFPLGMG